jgi:PTS system nitrogen regulatory IIA component
LETRIGLGAEEELHKLEGAIGGRSDAADAWSVAGLLPAGAIDVALPARTRNSVLEAMVDLAARTGWLWDPAKMVESVRNREEMHPTALENGVALLHPRRPLPQILEQPFLALGRTDRGVPFGGSRGVLTDLFFLICSADDTGHLRALARLSRLIGAAGFLEELRAAPDARQVHELIAAREQALPQ